METNASRGDFQASDHSFDDKHEDIRFYCPNSDFIILYDFENKTNHYIRSFMRVLSTKKIFFSM